MVSEHMKDVIRYAGHYERHFRETCEARVQSESKEALRSKKKQLHEKRIAKLDRLFIRLYDDNAASQIGDDRFGMKKRPMRMSSAS